MLVFTDCSGLSFDSIVESRILLFSCNYLFFPFLLLLTFLDISIDPCCFKLFNDFDPCDYGVDFASLSKEGSLILFNNLIAVSAFLRLLCRLFSE